MSVTPLRVGCRSVLGRHELARREGAPCGSRDHRESHPGRVHRLAPAPGRRARAHASAVASASATANEVPQCGGASGGKRSSAIVHQPADRVGEALGCTHLLGPGERAGVELVEELAVAGPAPEAQPVVACGRARLPAEELAVEGDRGVAVAGVEVVEAPRARLVDQLRAGEVARPPRRRRRRPRDRRAPPCARRRQRRTALTTTLPPAASTLAAAGVGALDGDVGVPGRRAAVVVLSSRRRRPPARACWATR